MEFVGQPSLSGACNLLGVPGLSSVDVDDDEGEIVIGIRPKSSPLPRRKSSLSDEDSEPGPPLCGSRRVSFADAKGLSLVQVKKFDIWDEPKLPEYDSSKGKVKDIEEYFICPQTFSLPLSTEELFAKVRDQKLELETIELLPGTTIVKGVIRVLNVSFNKAVYVRTTLDSWSSHFDLLAEYIPGSSEGPMDCFSFKLTLVPPFGEQGARVDFCLRYETSLGTFWANNNNRNYVLICQQRVKELKERPQREIVKKKSCLKIVSQNFSTEEDISPMEASFQENNKPDVPKHREEVDSMKAQPISDGQSGTSEEESHKLLTKSRRTCSRRSRRKAARTARVRDFFAQRNGAVDPERDESPPEAEQTSHEENHSDVQSLSEGNSKSLSKSLETCREPLLDVLQVTSPAHDCTSNGQPEKSESISLADSASLAEGESAVDISDSSLHPNDEPAPADHQTINRTDTKAEEGSLREGTSCGTAAESADTFISAVSNESLVSPSNSFTFGTVVAPLYHQVFGRAGSESQSVGGQEIAMRATPNAEDFTHTERRDTSCTVPTDANTNIDNTRGNVIKTLESSNQECVDATLKSPPMEEEETSLSATPNDILDHLETLQDPVLISHSHQTCTDAFEVPKQAEHTNTVSILNLDESSGLQREAREDNDLQSQTTAETAPARPSELTCTQMTATEDETLAQRETQDSRETSFMSLQPSQSESERISDEAGQQISGTGTKEDDDVGRTTTVPSEDDKLSEGSPDLSPYSLSNPAAKETENSYDSCFEIGEEKEVTSPQISLDTQEETTEVEEGNKVANNSHKDDIKHSAMKVTGEVAMVMGDMFVELNDEDSLKQEDIEIEHAAWKQDFCSADITEVRNWEMMVEEEEKNILTDDEEISLQAGDIEAVEEDRVDQLEDAWTEIVFVHRASTEKGQEEILVEEKQRIGEEEAGATVAGRGVEKEYVEATMKDKTPGEEGLTEKTELEKEIEEVDLERSNIQEVKEIEKEEEIDLKDKDKAGLEWEDKVVAREENVEEEIPDCKEDILVGDAESESFKIDDRGNEVGCFEERLEHTQNEVQDGLSAPVNGVQDNRVMEKDNTGEVENAHIQTEIHTYEKATHDLFKAMTDDNEFTADDPESDRASHGSASSESDSDDEVELYMHCLRAVHTGAQAQKDRSKDAGFSVGKRPSLNRGKLSSPMPSISESLDEEQNISCLQDNHVDTETAEFEPVAEDLPAASEQESMSRSVSWWKETFSCSNIAKTFLYATLLVFFLVVAYHYDFLACFGLYLMSLVWLWFQGGRQPVKSNKRIG